MRRYLTIVRRVFVLNLALTSTLTLLFTAHASQQRKVKPQSKGINLAFLSPAPNQKLSGYFVIMVLDINRTVVLKEVTVDYRRAGPGQSWERIGASQDGRSLFDIVQFAWDTRPLRAGSYILRAQAIGQKGETGRSEINVYLHKYQTPVEIKQRAPGECKCESMDILENTIPAASGLTFDSVRRIDRDGKKLGANIDTEDHLEVTQDGKRFLVRNFRLNFMVDATLSGGSVLDACSQEQQVKATVRLKGQKKSPEKDGVSYPFDKADYVRDGAGYLMADNIIKEHTNTDPIHIRWIDAPGSGNSRNDRRAPVGAAEPPGIEWQSAFYTYVKGTGEKSSCFCEFTFEMKMDELGAVLQTPRIVPGSKRCQGLTDLPR